VRIDRPRVLFRTRKRGEEARSLFFLSFLPSLFFSFFCCFLDRIRHPYIHTADAAAAGTGFPSAVVVAREREVQQS